MYLLAGAIATLVFLFVPGMRIGGLLNLIALSSPIAILIALRMNHVEYKLPWLLIALGQLFFVTGDVITYNYERFFGTELPYPSIGDVFYLSVYPCLFLGILLLIRHRSPGRDRDSAIDSLIVGIGVGVLSWVFLIAPYTHDTSLTTVQKLVSIGYPLMDLMLVTVAIRLAVGRGRKNPAFYLLLAGVVALFITDALYGWAGLHGGYDNQTGYLEGGWAAFYLLIGAAALHPAVRSFSERSFEVQDTSVADTARGPRGRVAHRPAHRRDHRQPVLDRHAAHRPDGGDRRVDHPVPARHRADVRTGPAAGEVGRSRTGAARSGCRARHGDEPRGDPRRGDRGITDPGRRGRGDPAVRRLRRRDRRVHRGRGRRRHRRRDRRALLAGHPAGLETEAVAGSRRVRRADPREHDPRAAVAARARGGLRARRTVVHARRVPRHDGRGDPRGDARIRGRQPQGALFPGGARARERGAHRRPAAPSERGAVRVVGQELLRRGGGHRADDRGPLREPVRLSGARHRPRGAGGHALHRPGPPGRQDAGAVVPHVGRRR